MTLLKEISIQEASMKYGSPGIKNKCKKLGGNLPPNHLSGLKKILEDNFENVIFDDVGKKGKKRVFYVDGEKSSTPIIYDHRVFNKKEESEIKKVIEEAFIKFLYTNTAKGVKEMEYLTDNDVLRKLKITYDDRLVRDNKIKLSGGTLPSINIENLGTLNTKDREQYVDKVFKSLKYFLGSVYFKLQQKKIIEITSTMICKKNKEDGYEILPLETAEEIISRRAAIFEAYDTNEYELIWSQRFKNSEDERQTDLKKCSEEIDELFLEYGYEFGFMGKKFIVNTSKKTFKDFVSNNFKHIDVNDLRDTINMRDKVAQHYKKQVEAKMKKALKKTEDQDDLTEGFGNIAVSSKKEEQLKELISGKMLEDTLKGNAYYFKNNDKELE